MKRHTPLTSNKVWPDPDKPRKPLARSPFRQVGAAIERSAPRLARAGAIPQQSAKRKAEAPERAQVNRQVAAEHGNRCMFDRLARSVAVEHVCVGTLAAHEVLKRARGGSHLDPAICVPLCNLHNGWVEIAPYSAEAIGLSVPSGTPEFVAAALAEAAEIRQAILRCEVSWRVPSWASDEAWYIGALNGLARIGWT